MYAFGAHNTMHYIYTRLFCCPSKILKSINSLDTVKLVFGTGNLKG